MWHVEQMNAFPFGIREGKLLRAAAWVLVNRTAVTNTTFFICMEPPERSWRE
jgi:hypothetical protein